MKLNRSLPLVLLTALNVHAGSNLISPEGSATATVQFTLDSYTIDTVTVDGVQYSRVRSPELDAITLDKGFPELPYGAEAIRLLKNGEAQLKISNVKYKEIPALPVVPSKGMMTRNIDPTTVRTTAGTVYNDDRFWPEQPVSLDAPYLIRDTRGVSARIFPVSYNGKTGTIRIAESITFSVIETGTSVRSASEDQSEEFRSLQDRFINGSTPLMLRYKAVNDGDKMAIITTSEFKAAADELALWKNKKGIVSTVYTYPSETGSGSAALRTFLKGLYTKEKITYITLIGDHEDIPSKLMNYDDGSAPQDASVGSDPSYTFLSGTDLYPDAFVGRISVESAASAGEVVKKIVNYEMKPQVGATWYSKAVCAGSSEGTPKDYQWLSDSINTVLKKAMYTSVDEIKQGYSESTTSLSNYLNEGRGLLNFMGHGNNDGFGFQSAFWYSSSLVKGLKNGNKLPVVIPLACQFGAFTGRTVAAEAWIRHATGGAVAVMGSSPLMDWTPPQYAQVEMNRLIAKDSHRSMGAYFYNGEMRMLDVDKFGEKTMNTWNYFGDPSVELINKAPVAIKLAVDGTPVIGANTLKISGTAGTKVTLYSPELGIQTSATLTGNSVDMKFDAAKAGKIYVTGTARNSAPYLDSIVVSSVQEKNLAPTDIKLSKKSVMADSPVGTLVGILTTIDPNKNDTHTYSLECSCTSLKLSNDSLIVSGPIAENDSMFLRLTTMDKGGLSFSNEITVAAVPNPYYDILGKGEWKANADSLGSTSKITIDAKTGAFKAKMKRAANTKYDKWTNIGTDFTGNIESLTEIRITYSATDSIKLLLPMDELLEAGSGHGITLPATGRASATVTIPVSKLVQPSWVTTAEATELNLKNVHNIMFEIASESETITEASFEVEELGIDSYKEVVGLLTGNAQTLAGIMIKGISSQQITIGVPQAGSYQIAFYTLNGRKIFDQTASLAAGFQSLPLTQQNACGPVIMQIQGPAGSFVTKAILK